MHAQKKRSFERRSAKQAHTQTTRNARKRRRKSQEAYRASSEPDDPEVEEEEEEEDEDDDWEDCDAWAVPSDVLAGASDEELEGEEEEAEMCETSKRKELCPVQPERVHSCSHGAGLLRVITRLPGVAPKRSSAGRGGQEEACWQGRW